MTNHADRPLDDWLHTFERIYYVSQNHERSVHQVLLRVCEAALNLHKATIKRGNFRQAKEQWLPKLFAWYAALLKSLRITGLSTLVWRKFPSACPFCLAPRCACIPGRAKAPIDRSALAALSADKSQFPLSLGEWQIMFDGIYSQAQRGPALRVESDWLDGRTILADAFLKLYEELFELSEAIRLRPFYPDNLKNEVADVFAAICAVANVLPTGFHKVDRIDLGQEVWRRYPDTCDTCRQRVCTCRHRGVSERLSSEGVREYERRCGLTGLYNREQYSRDLDVLFELPDDEFVGEMFFDCDDFKRFNDETPGGHPQGDAVLQYIAAEALDAAGADGTVYRYGGDEFVVLFRAQTANAIRSGAQRVFDRIKNGTVLDVTGSQKTYKVTISAGLAVRSQSMTASDDLERAADEAQYASKKAGKNRLTVADANLE